MGNSVEKEAEAPSRPPVNAADLEQAARQHRVLNETDEGRVECSCGMQLPSKHYYKLHIEVHAANLKPMHATGWPVKHFETVPYGQLFQKGICSKGDIENAIFQLISLNHGADDLKVRQAVSSLGDIANKVLLEFIENPDDREDEKTRLITVIGISPKLWRKWDSCPPRELMDFKDKICPQTGTVIFPSTDEIDDIFLMIKANRADLCYEIAKRFERTLGQAYKDSSQFVGFRYHHGVKFNEKYAADLTGFIDGTRNPDHLLRAIVDNVVIFEDDDFGKHIGGSYLYAGRFVHNLRKFDCLDSEEKNQIVGRDYHSVEPHIGYDRRPENPRLEEEETHEAAHVLRGFGSMHRHAMPYRLPKEEGLFFASVARSLYELDTAIERMAGKYSSDGSPDNLFKITKNVSSNYFYVPSLKELELLAKDSLLNSDFKSPEEATASDQKETKEVEIVFEYCTNCGYNSLYREKKLVLEHVWPGVKIIPNPKMPRLSGFEISTKDGVVLWSKLSQPDGHNNYPHVFPTNLQLENNFRKYLGLPEVSESTVKLKLYENEGTTVGVW